MEFVFNIEKVKTIEGNKVSVKPVVVDGYTQELGELTMEQSQWDILRAMLVHGQSYFLDGEVTVRFYTRT